MKLRIKFLLVLCFLIITVGLITLDNPKINTEKEIKKELKIKKKKARADYFFNMLRDPKINEIPKDFIKKEAEFAKRIEMETNALNKANSANFEWKEAGPNDVGGRTRALAVDRTNSDVILAGGVSGGVWKSIDKGETWQLKSKTDQHLSVSSIAQDYETPTTWYYTSGEYEGNSAGDRGGRARFYGSGFFRSTDNGESWEKLHSAGNDKIYDSKFDYVSKVMVNPVSGSVFIASHNLGLFKSTDKGLTFNYILGGLNDHNYVEFDIHSSGNIIATLSSGYNDTTSYNPGIYLSKDDGETWTSLMDENYVDPERSVVAFAPSNKNVAYAWTSFADGNGFYKLDLLNKTYEDRTENIPNYGDPAGTLESQQNYNMAIAVKPNDENFVLLGGINIFRSFDGFSSQSDDKLETWIGGYNTSNDFSGYPNHHPDIHSLFFDPNNPNKLWSGHDGGLSYTEDVTVKDTKVEWINKNNGYNVTQYYHASISNKANHNFLLGGTQDNGTPIFSFDGTTTTESEDISTGDGSFSYYGEKYLYTSQQNGKVIKFNLDNHFNPIYNSYTFVYPNDAKDNLFIHPFAIDPSDENVMYYPEGNTLWKNTSITTISGYYQNGVTKGWTNLGAVDKLEEATHLITTLAVSNENPSNVLYMGLSNWTDQPKVIKLENAVTDSNFTDISIPFAEQGSYIHNISVNPNNGNEFIVTLSNYNIVSLYHSTDGGETYTAISGNLDNEGPSVRATSILPINEEIYYFAATSIGLFSTTKLDGENTIWQFEGRNTTGNVVVSYVTSRKSDGNVIAATHGRGIFIGVPTTPVSVNEEETLPVNFILSQNYPNPFNPSTIIGYTIPDVGARYARAVILTVYDALGRKIETILEEKQFPGNYKVNFDATAVGRTLSSGVYFYNLKVDGFEKTKKMILAK